jgi:hypothetical protein
MRLGLAIALSCVLVGCAEPAPGGPGLSSRVGVFDFPQSGRIRLDIMLVVDDSTAMAPYRDHVVADVPALADVLSSLSTGMPDVNIAVTTAVADGSLRTASAVDGGWIVDGMRDGVRTQNYTGDLDAAIAALVDVGASGTGAVQPLEVIPQALATPGFLRERAYLMVAIVTATDDASSVTVDAAVSSLKGVKDDPASVIVAGIHPQSAPRLEAFLGMFPHRATSTSIDAEDFTTAFALIAELHRNILGLPCVQFTPLDVDPDTAGDQYECVIEERRVAEGTVLLPRCSDSNAPCWDFVPHPFCSQASGLALEIERGTTGLPYDGSVIHGECLIE